MRFFISTLALLSGIFLGLTSLLSVLVVIMVSSRWVDGRYSAGLALFIGVFSVLMGVLFGWLAWRAIRHLRAPDSQTAKEVLAVVCFLFGVQVLGALRPGAKGDSRDYGALEWMAGMGTAMMLILLYHYVLRTLADRSYPPRSPGRQG